MNAALCAIAVERPTGLTGQRRITLIIARARPEARVSVALLDLDDKGFLSRGAVCFVPSASDLTAELVEVVSSASLTVVTRSDNI